MLFVVDCCSGFAQSPQPAMVDVSTVKELPIQWRLGDKAIILVPSSNDGSTLVPVTNIMIRGILLQTVFN